MSVVSAAKSRARDRPLTATALLSVVGYVLVIGTFAGALPIYPEVSRAGVHLLGDLIAVVNAAATVSLVLGWRWIRRNEVRKHKLAMSTAFALILVFLVLYLLKVGGGGRKDFVGPSLWYGAYLAMLAVHIVLSIVSVPVVLYALTLGLTHTPAELRGDTPHRRVGRIAAGAWITSLVLGVATYVMLNHVFAFEFVPAVLGLGTNPGLLGLG